MKIAFVSLMKVFPWGGSEELWYRTAKLALQKGHTVYTLTQKWPVTPDKILDLENKGAKTKFYFQPRYSLFDRIEIKFNFKKYLTYVVPDISADLYIISNGTTFDFIYLQQITDSIIKTGRPYIFISQHNYESGGLITGSHRSYGNNLINNAIKFLFVSERNLITAKRQIVNPLINAQVIGNPVNIKKADIKPYPISAKLLMACVARIDCSFKGQDILLQVLSAAQWRSREFSLKFYGVGPHLDHLQKLILMFDLQDKVSIEGHTNNLEQIWKTNQVLLLPSLSEGTSLALVEAMLSGRAVLTTDVGDHDKYVFNGLTGFLADTASLKCISKSLEDLWRNKDSLQKMGEKAYKHALQITDLQAEHTLMNIIETAIEVIPKG